MSEAKKAGTTLESIKVLPFYGSDTSKGGLEPREFFMKAEVFAATKGNRNGEGGAAQMQRACGNPSM